MYCHALGAWGQASGVNVGVAACGKSVSSISRSLVFQTCLLHTSICYFEIASDRQSKQIRFVNFKSTRSHSRADVMITKNKRPYIQALPWMHWNTKKYFEFATWSSTIHFAWSCEWHLQFGDWLIAMMNLDALLWRLYKLRVPKETSS